MKTCLTCNKEKEVTEFYPKYAKCKACFYDVIKKYRASEIGKESRRKEAINTRRSGKKQIRQKRYEGTEKAKLADKRYEQKRYQSPKGKLRQAAKNAVKYALKMGRLVKEPCFVCGLKESVAHHSSYARDMRLVVTWLCTPHHNEIHNPVEV